MPRGRPSKKQLIIDTAKKLFAERGLQGTSIDLVVQEAGVSKPTIYNNFPTKNALLEEMVSQLTSELVDTLSGLNVYGSSVEDKVTSAYYWIAEHPEQLAIFRIWYGESYKLEEDIKAMLLEYESHLLMHCKELLLQNYPEKEVAQIDETLLLVTAVCRELILIPVLSGKQPFQNINVLLKKISS